jgi:hypothetical protein
MTLKMLALCGLASLPLFASEIVFTDQSIFTATVDSTRNRSILTETFSSTTLLTGLSIVSEGGGAFGLPPGPGYGHVDTTRQAWLDCAGKDCPGSFGLGNEPYTGTTIHFDKPLYGLAGDWKVDGGDGISLFPNNGAGEVDILFSTDPSMTLFPVPTTAYPQGFVGFTTSQPFQSVFISWFAGIGAGNSTSFELRDLKLVATPEPAAWGLLTLGALLFATRTNWRKRM